MAVVNMDKRANLNRNGTIVLHFKTSQGNIPTLAIIIHLKGGKKIEIRRRKGRMTRNTATFHPVRRLNIATKNDHISGTILSSSNASPPQTIKARRTSH